MRPMNHRNPWLPTVFNDLFDVNLMPRMNTQAPAINVLESEKSYTVEFAAPGMKKEDFSVNINGEGNLIVKMERKARDSRRRLARKFAMVRDGAFAVTHDHMSASDITACSLLARRRLEKDIRAHRRARRISRNVVHSRAA